MVVPFLPVLKQVTTTPYSVIISWIIPSIVFDQENYTVQYGSDMTIVSSTSYIVQGNDDLDAINDSFSINITGLAPFTRYYCTIVATNSVGSTNNSVMNFMTNETGTHS